MTEALEWVQCNGCGRRHRWTAERAGTMFNCECGYRIWCPEGASAEVDTNPAETLVEDIDSPTAADPEIDGLELGDIAPAKIRRAILPRTRREAQRAAKSFVIWSILLLIGLAMVIHLAVLYPYLDTQLRVQIYAGLAVIIFPLALIKWFGAKRRWQRGRGFIEAISDSLSKFGDESTGETQQ